MMSTGAVMNRQEATRRIEEYFGGWKDRDSDRLLSALSDDVAIVECDGTAYHGLDRVHRWFADWHAEPVNGRVTAWEIRGVLFDDARCVATVEWDFSCVCYGQPSSFLGASVIEFDETGITRVREYRMDDGPPSAAPGTVGQRDRESKDTE